MKVQEGLSEDWTLRQEDPQGDCGEKAWPKADTGVSKAWAPGPRGTDQRPLGDGRAGMAGGQLEEERRELRPCSEVDSTAPSSPIFPHRIHLMAGRVPRGADGAAVRGEMETVFLENLRHAADVLARVR